MLDRSTKLGMLIELNEYYNFALGDLDLITGDHRQNLDRSPWFAYQLVCLSVTAL